MRFSLIVAMALLLTPVALTARPTGATSLTPVSSTDISAAKKKAAKKAKKTEENLKAAPSAPPATKY